MDKTYKHKAKSILESDDKQFISKSEKESFIDHIKNHPEEINKDDYYTKEEVNHIASSSISKDLGIVDTNPCSIINAEKHGYLPLPEEVMNLIGPNKEYQYWCLSQKVNGDKVCILTKINSIVDRVSFDVDGNIKLSTENDREFSMFSLSQASNKNSWIVHNASIVTGGFFVIGSENIYSNYDLINKDTGEVIFKGKEMNHTLFQLARAEEATIRSYTGKTGELTVDLTNKTVVLQDGVTAGGISLAKEQEVNKVIADLDTHINNHPEGFSGNYNDLTNKPNLEKFENHINNHPEGFSGDYNDLINKPNLKEFQDHIDNHPEIKDVDLSDYYNKREIDDKLDLLPTLENFKNWGEIPTDEEACLYANTINYPPLPNDVGGRNAYPYWGIFYVPRYSDKHHLFVSTSKSIRVSKTMYELRWHVWGVSKCYTWTPGSSEWVNESIPSEMETGTDTSCYLKECNYYNLSGFSTIPNKGGDGHIVIRQARGTSDALDTYTGKEGELTVDTTNKILRIQDGVTKGGIALAKKSEVDTLTSRIEEVFQSVSNGKRLIAEAVTDKGIETLATDTFETIRENINNLNAFKFYLGEEEPQNPEEGSMWFPEIDKNEKVNLCFTNTESYIQKVDGTILGTISLKELDRFPLLNISNFMTVRMFNFKHFKGGYGNIIPAYIYNYNKWISVYNFPPFDGTSIKYKIKIDSKFDNLTSCINYKLSMSNIVQEPIKNSFTINSKIKINNELEIPEIISK